MPNAHEDIRRHDRISRDSPQGSTEMIGQPALDRMAPEHGA